MIGFERHKKNKVIPTIKIVDCPACSKNRLRKYTNSDGSVDPASAETVEVRDEIRYLEVCEHCVSRYQAADEKFVKDNLKKLAKAIQSGPKPEDDGESDHRDFSLN